MQMTLLAECLCILFDPTRSAIVLSLMRHSQRGTGPSSLRCTSGVAEPYERDRFHPQVMAALDHPNIVKLHETYPDAFARSQLMVAQPMLHLVAIFRKLFSRLLLMPN